MRPTQELPAAPVVIDVETTGFGKHDRLVEIAIVAMDPESWETVDEYDTLLNPERDIGPIGVHGVSASMVEVAPVFSDVVADISRRVNGALLVGHNLPFDARMLRQEFERNGVQVDLRSGLCTFRETRQKLEAACKERGVELACAHRALADARATAELARRLWGDEADLGAEPVRVGYVAQKPSQRTVRRGLVDAGVSPMHRVVARSHYPHCDELILGYLDALDWVLDDSVIDQRERAEIKRLAQDLGIPERERLKAHRDYFDCIVAAARRDGVASPAEHEIIARIADQLELADVEIPDPTPVAVVENLAPGDRLCFTGTAFVDGKTWVRDDLQALARKASCRSSTSPRRDATSWWPPTWRASPARPGRRGATASPSYRSPTSWQEPRENRRLRQGVPRRPGSATTTPSPRAGGSCRSGWHAVAGIDRLAGRAHLRLDRGRPGVTPASSRLAGVVSLN